MTTQRRRRRQPRTKTAPARTSQKAAPAPRKRGLARLWHGLTNINRVFAWVVATAAGALTIAAAATAVIKLLSHPAPSVAMTLERPIVDQQLSVFQQIAQSDLASVTPVPSTARIAQRAGGPRIVFASDPGSDPATGTDGGTTTPTSTSSTTDTTTTTTSTTPSTGSSSSSTGTTDTTVTSTSSTTTAGGHVVTVAPGVLLSQGVTAATVRHLSALLGTAAPAAPAILPDQPPAAGVSVGAEPDDFQVAVPRACVSGDVTTCALSSEAGNPALGPSASASKIEALFKDERMERYHRRAYPLGIVVTVDLNVEHDAGHTGSIGWLLTSDGGAPLAGLWAKRVYPYRPTPPRSPWSARLPLWIPEPLRAGRYALIVWYFDSAGTVVVQRERAFTLPSFAQVNR